MGDDVWVNCLTPYWLNNVSIVFLSSCLTSATITFWLHVNLNDDLFNLAISYSAVFVFTFPSSVILPHSTNAVKCDNPSLLWLQPKSSLRCVKEKGLASSSLNPILFSNSLLNPSTPSLSTVYFNRACFLSLRLP